MPAKKRHLARVRIAGWSGGGLTPPMKTWTPPKRGKNNRSGGSIHLYIILTCNRNPLVCHCIIRTLHLASTET